MSPIEKAIEKVILETWKRKAESKSFSEISKLSGVSRSHVSRVIRGKCGVSEKTGEKIARACGLTYLEFVSYLRHFKRGKGDVK